MTFTVISAGFLVGFSISDAKKQAKDAAGSVSVQQISEAANGFCLKRKFDNKKCDQIKAKATELANQKKCSMALECLNKALSK
jgi:hypothetical protein